MQRHRFSVWWRRTSRNLIEDFVGKSNRLIDSRDGWYHPDIDLPLPCKPDAGDQARAEVDQTAIEARHAGVGIGHKTTIAKKRRIDVASNCWVSN